MITNEQRQQELNDKFSLLEGWAGEEEYRIAEKEKDAKIILNKLIENTKNLKENTSLLALDDDNLAELLNKINTFSSEVAAEVSRRS